MRAAFPGRCHLALTLRRRPGDAARLQDLADMAQRARVPSRRHRRRALPRTAAPHPAGRHHLHPRRMHHRRCRLPPRAVRRPPPEAAGGDGATVRATTPRRSPDRPRSPRGARSAWPSLATSIRTSSQRDDETPQQGLERLVRESLPLRYAEGIPPAVRSAARARAAADRRAGLRALLPDREQHRPLRPVARASCARAAARPPTPPSATCWASPPSTRAQRPAVRAVHQPGAQGAAGHRRRLRERAARGGHPVGLRALWPRPRRAVRDGHVLRPARRHPRRGQGARPDRGRHRRPRLPGLGLVEGGRGERARGRAEPQPRRPPPAAGHRPGPRAHRLPAPARHPSWRLRAHARPAGRTRARSSPPRWPGGRSSSGTRTTSTP